MSDKLIGQPAKRSPVSRVGSLFLLMILGGYIALASIGCVLSMPDIPHKADALVLLSGGDKLLEEEIARLYKKGYASVVILTRTGGSTRGNHLYTLQDLAKLDVPARTVLFTPGQATSTYDEARHVLELMDAKNLGTVMVVSDPYHVFRARLIFKGEFRESGKAVWVRGAHSHWYKPLTWMFSEQGWEVTIKELVKIGGYFIGFKGG